MIIAGLVANWSESPIPRMTALRCQKELKSAGTFSPFIAAMHWSRSYSAVCFLPLSDRLDWPKVLTGRSVGEMTEFSPVTWVAAMMIIAQGRDASNCPRLKESGEKTHFQKEEGTSQVLRKNL